MPSNWIKNYLGNYELTVWQGPFDKNQLRQDGNLRSMYYWLYTQGKKYLQIYQTDEGHIDQSFANIIGERRPFVTHNLGNVQQRRFKGSCPGSDNGKSRGSKDLIGFIHDQLHSGFANEFSIIMLLLCRRARDDKFIFREVLD